MNTTKHTVLAMDVFKSAVTISGKWDFVYDSFRIRCLRAFMITDDEPAAPFLYISMVQ